MPCLFYFWILAEIIVFILVGSWIGVGYTLLLILLTTLLGFILMRNESLSVMQKMQDAMRQGKPPTFASLESSVLVFAGMLLILPGFISDAIGLLCLIPGLRKSMIKGFAKAGFQTHVHTQKPKDDDSIDGEFWEDKPDQKEISKDDKKKDDQP